MIDRELRELRRDLKVTRKAAFAAGTHKNHLTQWQTYLLFCLYFSFDFLPATVDTVCLFSQFLSRSLTPASVRNYLSGVKFLHVALGHDFPSLRTFSIRITLRGIDRMALHCPTRAPPVTPSILFSLIQLSRSVDSSPEYITFSCAFLFAFFLWHVFLTSFLFLRDLLIVVSICVEGISFQPLMDSLSLLSGLKLIRLVYVICFCL